MGRKPDEVYQQDATPGPIPEISAERAAALAQVQDSAAVATQAVMDAEEALRAVGQIEGLDFLRRVADVATAQVFEKLKDNKSYKNLPYKDVDGNLRHVADLEEFCSAFLSKSYRRCQELSKNLHLLGPDLYESAERIGFRARDYRALKALPAEDQAVVKQALASESKEEVLGILEDLAARHHAEREAAKKEAAELKADLEARAQVLEAKTKTLDRTQEELVKLKSLPPAQRAHLALEREAAAAERLNLGEVKATAAVNEWYAEVADVLEAEDVSQPTRDYAATLVRHHAERLAALCAGYGIAVDFADIVRPEWTRGDAARALGLDEEAQG
jgi:hypothetical protein